MTNAESPHQPFSLTVEQALHQAIAHHQAGQWQDAERLYRTILQAQPDHPDVNHNLGVLAVQVKQPAAGLPHLKAALEADPNQDQYWLSYIDALIQTGQTDAARQVLEQGRQRGLQGDAIDALAGRLEENNPSPQEIETLTALFAEGRYTDAATLAQMMTVRFPLHGFGWKVLGAVFQQMGRSAEALVPMQKAAALSPGDAQAFSNLGAALKDLGRPDEAEVSLRRALEIRPNFADAHNNLGNTLQDLGRLDEAEASYRRALEINPHLAETHNNLGNTLHKIKRLDEAAASCRRALEIKPDFAEAHSNLGNILKDLGRLDEAEVSYRRALAIKPDFAKAHNNLGRTLHDLDRLDEAEASYLRALEVNPDDAVVHYNLGKTLEGLGRLDSAEASYRRALEIKPDFAEAHYNLGIILHGLGRLDEAEASYRQALSIRPDYVEAHSNLLFCFNYDPHLSAAEVFAEHLLWDERQTGACTRVERTTSDRNPQRRLRVGYVSPDLRQHSVAYFFEPLLREHDRQVIEVYCYAEVARPDEVTARLQRLADKWLRTVDISDEALARRIADDKIDILVDLAGHTAKNRLLTFARKPAPVQVTWLGYPHSTGLRTMDYRLVDALTDPPGEADVYASETLVRLENGFLCYAPPEDAPLPAAPPSLANGSVTFGSFNNPAKLSSATLDVWAMLLGRVPNSRLLVKGKRFNSAVGRAAFLGQLQQRGVDPHRVTLLGSVPGLADHLALYEQVDIALDPFPYNGTTTTCEALWMGVPVISLHGNCHAGRVGASLLTQIGLTELIAASAQAYVDIAAGLAGDTPRLNELRRTLRARLAASPLCDAPAFARKIEAAYRDMWRRYCASADPMPTKSQLTDNLGRKSASANLPSRLVAKHAPEIKETPTINREPSTVRRLHIGGIHHVPGWEVLNVNPGPYVDHLCDATDLSRFPDNTFAEIYASHIVEHFDYKVQLVAALKEWHRAMRPGGVLRVSVPDMDVLVGLFLDKNNLSVSERFFVMRMMFGGHTDKYDYHLVGLNEEFLASFLGQAGFAQISRVKDFGLFDDTSGMSFRGVPISLNMIAHKPLVSH